MRVVLEDYRHFVRQKGLGVRVSLERVTTAHGESEVIGATGIMA